MNKTKNDIQWIKQFLFPHKYDVTAKKEGEIRCIAKDGGIDDITWESFILKCEQQFGKRISEFYHEVNYRHKDFFVYLKKPDFSNIGRKDYLQH